MLLIPATLVDGVLAVIGALIPSIYLSVIVLIIVCVAQLIAIWRLSAFKRGYLNGMFACIVVVALIALWWANRPSPQPQAATRSDVHEEVIEAVKQIITPTPLPTPTPANSPSPQPEQLITEPPKASRKRSLGSKSNARLRKERALRILHSQKP